MQDLLHRLNQSLASLLKGEDTVRRETRRFVLAGKRLRARLLFASSVVCGDDRTPDLVSAAAAVELVHAASLLHDDIVDACEERRGRASFHRDHGVARATSAGTELVHMALRIVANLPQWARKDFAAVGQTVARGQLLELLHASDVTHTANARLEIMRSKTASVFAFACELGSRLSGQDEAAVALHRRFGDAFGMLFQIADDIDDLFASRQEQGRLPATDLRGAVMSLPIVLALDTDRDREMARLLELSGDNRPTDVGTWRAFLRSKGALRRTSDIADAYAREARQSLAAIPFCSHAEWLSTIVDATASRITRFDEAGETERAPRGAA